MNLATLYYNNQQYNLAENMYLEVMQKMPEYGGAYYSLALLDGELHRDDEAINLLEKAITIMPENIRHIQKT